MAKARYSKPSSEQWAEEVASGKYDAEHSKVHRGDDPKESDDGFIGVSDEYRNFSDPIHKPLQGDGKVGELEKQYLSDEADADKGATPEGESQEQDEEEEDAKSSSSGSSRSSTSSTGGGSGNPPSPTPPSA